MNKFILLINKKKPGNLNSQVFKSLRAVWTGLEPATSAVTGRHSNQLNYQTKVVNCLLSKRHKDISISEIFILYEKKFLS